MSTSTLGVHANHRLANSWIRVQSDEFSIRAMFAKPAGGTCRLKARGSSQRSPVLHWSGRADRLTLQRAVSSYCCEDTHHEHPRSLPARAGRCVEEDVMQFALLIY